MPEKEVACKYNYIAGSSTDNTHDKEKQRKAKHKLRSLKILKIYRVHLCSYTFMYIYSHLSNHKHLKLSKIS